VLSLPRLVIERSFGWTIAAYSLLLCKCIVDAVERGFGTRNEIAKLLRERMKKKARVGASAPTISSALRSLGLSRKENYPSGGGRSGRKGQVRMTAKKAAS